MGVKSHSIHPDLRTVGILIACLEDDQEDEREDENEDEEDNTNNEKDN